MSERLVDGWLVMVRAAGTTERALERQLSARHGLCVAAFEILRTLERGAEPMSLSAVGAAVSRSQSRVSRLVAQLSQEGYLSREVHPSDARASRVGITSRGSDLLLEAEATAKHVIESFLEDGGLLSEFFKQDLSLLSSDII